MIYRLKHPSPDFTGYFGVDFYHGVGTTSNKKDADRLCLVHGVTLLVEGVETNGAGIGGPVPVPDIKPDTKPCEAVAIYSDSTPSPDTSADTKPAKVKPGRKPKAK
jgi:hypothetical protein